MFASGFLNVGRPPGDTAVLAGMSPTGFDVAAYPAEEIDDQIALYRQHGLGGEYAVRGRAVPASRQSHDRKRSQRGVEQKFLHVG